MLYIYIYIVQDSGWSRNLVILSVNGKVVRVHHMKAYCGIGSTVPLVLNLGKRLSGQLHALTGISSGRKSPAFIEHKFG